MIERVDMVFISFIYDIYSPDRLALTTKNIGNPAAETTVREGENGLDEREEANDRDGDLIYDIDTEGDDSCDECLMKVL